MGLLKLLNIIYLYFIAVSVFINLNINKYVIKFRYLNVNIFIKTNF